MPTIVGPLPFNIQNGQVIDAIPAMANWNWLVNQVNANVPGLIPANQSSIPTFVPTANVGGTANAITLAPNPAITTYAEGQSFRFHATAQNTSSVTISVSGLAAQSLQTAVGNPMVGAEMQAGGIYDIAYTGSAFQLINFSQGSQLNLFTPTVSFGGASVGISYFNQVGYWYKIGPMVYVWVYVRLANKGTSTGIAQVDGLPFAVSAFIPAGGSIPMGAVSFISVATTTFEWVCCAPVPGSVSIQFPGTRNAGAQGVLDDTFFVNTSGIFLSTVYPT